MRKKIIFFLLFYIPLNISAQCPDGVSATITSSTNELCNGSCTGSATVTASSGNSPYTYSWSPSGGSNKTASNLCARSYTVTVTDTRGCTATASVSITQPTPITITITATSGSNCGSCNGTATASASGGTSPYAYTWLTKGGNKAAATGLCAGDDTVVVTDANGCTASLVVLIDNNNVTPSYTTTNVKCNGNCTGSLAAAISGGNTPYTYAWSNGGSNNSITGLCVGTYSVLITDNKGCFAHAASLPITQPTALTSTNYSVPDFGLPCNGVAAVTASGATIPYTYLWSPGGQTKDTIKSQCAGIFCCTITDGNGCTLKNCVTVLYNSPLPVTLTSFTATYVEPTRSVIINWTVATQLNNKEFVIQKTVDGITYTDIATIAGAGTTPFEKSYSVVDNSPVYGTCYYRLEQIDMDGNLTVFPPITLSILNTTNNISFKVFPNPSDGIFTIESLGVTGQFFVEIYNVLSEKVYTIKLNAYNTSLNLSGQPRGVYFYRVINENGEYVANGKILIK